MTMKTPALIATLVFALAAGCTHPRASVTPQQRTDALRLYIGGASATEVAATLALDPAVARASIRSSLLELNRRYTHDR
jgi:hypothetical protein